MITFENDLERELWESIVLPFVSPSCPVIGVKAPELADAFILARRERIPKPQAAEAFVDTSEIPVKTIDFTKSELPK